jgi:phospholipase C
MRLVIRPGADACPADADGGQMDGFIRQRDRARQTSIDLAWTDITWLLYRYHVSWRYYVQAGTQPDCDNDSAETCPPARQSARTPGIWNPLPLFGDVQKDHQASYVQSLDSYFSAARAGQLPAVSWITPSGPNSEHPPASVHRGQAYVTSIVNAAMKSPDWDSTAIFLSWDDWGGFYDHVVLPQVDQNGYGLPVPAIVISPYARHGYIDHQTLSSDAYLKSSRTTFSVAPGWTRGPTARADPRPDVREDEPGHWASCRTRPRVRRRPERTTLTPCRTGAADQPRTDSTRAIGSRCGQNAARRSATRSGSG